MTIMAAMATTAPVTLSNPTWDEISSALRLHYPNMCICWMDSIQNNALKTKYEKRKETIKLARKQVTEMRVYHGTKAGNVESIIENGFQTSHNRTCAYGIGTYFSNDANMSSFYTNMDKSELSYMFVCKLLVGNIKVGVHAEEVDTSKYDNTMNLPENAKIYTTPYDDGAFPEYIIAFYKNAK